MAHLWTIYFLTLWEIELAVIFQKYEKSFSKIKNKIISQKLNLEAVIILSVFKIFHINIIYLKLR